MSDEIADFRSAETVPVVEGNTKPSVFVRAVRLRGVQEPMHVRTSTQGTWECAVERRFLLAGANPAQQLSLRLVAARAVYGGNDVD